MTVAAGVLEFIPLVGPAIAAVALTGVGFFSGYSHWLALLGFVGAWRLMQDYVNIPHVMGEGLELHPLAAIFGIHVGGEAGGIPGMYLSIPVIAGLRIIWHNWRLHGAREQSRSVAYKPKRASACWSAPAEPEVAVRGAVIPLVASRSRRIQYNGRVIPSFRILD